VGVCDTNSNPMKAKYVIPANDDATHAIKMIAALMAEAINEGRAEWEKKKAEMPKEAAKKVEPVRKESRALKKEESV